MTTGRLTNRVALVTGASRGIGAALARHLAAEGAHVILLARTIGGLEEVDDAIRAAGGSATLMPLDLRKLDQIDPVGPTIYDRFGGLDIFIGNAGVLGGLSPVGHFTPKAWTEVFDVNVHANWRLIRTLAPLLERSDAGRAVFVTADAARVARPYWAAYAASKAALTQMALVWAAETRKTALRVNLFDPGPVATNLRTAAYPGEDSTQLLQPDDVARDIVALATSAYTRHGEVCGPGPAHQDRALDA